ncbi:MULTISPECIES: ABC transporter substrate-binding protein [unclassified Acidovorax]|uniref:ABC transporter substrate-binding protein n=1 Tax=unclassified Acidovorax TaxID=2684926 RepID=UPI001C456485|nr:MULTISPECIES: ABC transporter substrate-binding protein [unclassified Acidovorax]MBV7427370.1 ABC transporter substrate-binding protein [Acidovorax sp. sif0732]MBV7448494.1 ABC transporter substrate-binding protein [Acidovorax sp. sif0715]
MNSFSEAGTVIPRMLRALLCGTGSLLLMASASAVPIVVAQVAPLSGFRASDGRGYSAGMQMYFNHVNKSGGINGNTLVLVRKDDGGSPEQTLASTQQLLIEHRPILLAGYMGASNLAMLQQSGVLAKEKIALVGYRGGIFQPGSSLIYNVRADFRDEVGKIAEHLATVGITRLGILYEESQDAAAQVASAHEAIKKHGGTLIVKASYESGTLQMEPANKLFQAAKPQAIILVTSGAAASSFIEKYRLEGGSARLFATSDVDLEQMSKRLAEEHMQGISIAQVTPNPYRVASKLSKELREVQAKSADADVPISYAMMEGYIAAKVIAEAARRAGSRPSRESMSAALDSIENFDLGGYMIGYRPDQRTGSRFVELSIISATGRIRQ